jgi:hypothetical protein
MEMGESISRSTANRSRAISSVRFRLRNLLPKLPKTQDQIETPPPHLHDCSGREPESDPDQALDIRLACVCVGCEGHFLAASVCDDARPSHALMRSSGRRAAVPSRDLDLIVIVARIASA